MIQPIPLEITPVQKNVLLDNIEIFKKNGFCFDIKDEECIKIISTPVHRNWTFGASDVEELLFMLSDSPGNANYTVGSLPSSINVDDLRGTTGKLGANEAGTELLFNDNLFVTNPWWASHHFEANNT